MTDKQYFKMISFHTTIMKQAIGINEEVEIIVKNGISFENLAKLREIRDDLRNCARDLIDLERELTKVTEEGEE